MTENLEIVRGSGNVFRDIGHANADVEQAKALLAAEIVGVLDDGGFPPVRRRSSPASITASLPASVTRNSTASPSTVW